MKHIMGDTFDEAFMSWRIRCGSTEEQAQVIALLTDSITAAVDESEVFVYGDLTGASKQLAGLAGLTIERQVCQPFIGSPKRLSLCRRSSALRLMASVAPKLLPRLKSSWSPTPW